MVETDLSKQQEVDADQKVIKQINFTRYLDRNRNTTMFFIIEEAKETILDFSWETVKVLWISSYDLARVAIVFDRSACSTIYFTLI